MRKPFIVQKLGKIIVAAILVMLLSIALSSCAGKTLSYVVGFSIDGEITHRVSTMGNERITMPEEPTKEGYVFDGWYWDKDTWQVKFTDSSLLDLSLSENLVVYARWISDYKGPEVFTVTFDSVSGSSISPVTLEKDSLIASPSDPRRTGYTFMGWFKEADYTSKWNFEEDKVKKDMTLYARWMADEYKNSVDFVKKEGITQEGDNLHARVSNATAEYRINDYLATNPFASLKVFEDGEKEREKTSGKVSLELGDNVFYVLVTSALGTNEKLYIFTVHRNFMYEVKFVVDSDETEIVRNVEEGGLLVDDISPKKTGYALVEWQKDGIAWDFEGSRVESNMLLRAVWEVLEVNVSFHSDGGDEIQDKIITFGENFTFEIPVKEGYIFSGWETVAGVLLTNSEGESIEGWNIEEDVKVYPRWEAITYAITYELDGGENNPSNPSSFTILGATQGIELLEPTKEKEIIILNFIPLENGQNEIEFDVKEYVFLGWYTESSFVNKVTTLPQVLGDLTLYANWNTESTITTQNAYERINALGELDADGEYILFGEYPQTLKEEDVKITEEQDSRGYYLGDDDCYYAKVTAAPFDKRGNYTFSTGATVENDAVYFFKVEPIKWRILSESNGEALILCESIIAAKRYNENYEGKNEEGDYANNYMNSELRAWLNSEFYNTAFSELSQVLIQVTEVDNSPDSTGEISNKYACADTDDKIFLPSFLDVVNSEYGFSSEDGEYDIPRRRRTSDYSRATGAYMSASSSYYGNGFWWLRSPDKYSPSWETSWISQYGAINYNGEVNDASLGVVPTLIIKIS